MSTSKHLDKICVLITALIVLVVILFMFGQNLGLKTVQEDENAVFSSTDLDSDWDTSNATQIELNGDSAFVEGNGSYAMDGKVYIASAGKYIISGTLENGSIIVSANDKDDVFILLNGVSLTCDESAAILVENANHVYITLAEDTENVLTSSCQDSIDGVIYSHDSLTINGNGTLNVKATNTHGIVCNDDLIITGGNIGLEATADAIHANDSVKICNANINITAGDDGITVSNDEATDYLYVECIVCIQKIKDRKD